MFKIKVTTYENGQIIKEWVESYFQFKDSTDALKTVKKQAYATWVCLDNRSAYHLHYVVNGAILKQKDLSLQDSATAMKWEVVSIPDFKLKKESSGNYTFLGNRYMLNRNFNGCYDILVRVKETESKREYYIVPDCIEGRKIFTDFWSARRYVKTHWGHFYINFDKIAQEAINYAGGKHR